MASANDGESGPATGYICINEILTDDELRSILSRLDTEKDREIFGLVCKRWLHLQSSERKKLAARAGPHMLVKLASRFFRVTELDLSQSVSRSFYPGVTDRDLYVIASKFRGLKVLHLQNCKGAIFVGSLSVNSPRIVKFMHKSIFPPLEYARYLLKASTYGCFPRGTMISFRGQRSEILVSRLMFKAVSFI